jgi:hypothetical protein
VRLRFRGKAGTPVDQNTTRRRGTGLRAIDGARASPGLTLLAPMSGDGTVYLMATMKPSSMLDKVAKTISRYHMLAN